VNRGSTPEIFVFNSHNDKTGCEKEDEKKRYQRFFSDKGKVHYEDKSFQDFCREGITQ
jgi:hypothetical protein